MNQIKMAKGGPQMQPKRVVEFQMDCGDNNQLPNGGH